MSIAEAEPQATLGEILLLEFMLPRGFTLRSLSGATGITEEVITEVIEGTRSMNKELSGKLGQAFGESAEFWERLATTVSWTERMRLRSKYDSTIRVDVGREY